MTDGWELVADRRRSFAELIAGLNETQLDTPTTCGHWTVRHIVGHLTTFVAVPFPKFVFNMARSGFSYDKAADRMAQDLAARPMDELLATLRAGADKAAPLPVFPAEMTLSDIEIHRQEVVAAVGGDASVPEHVTRPILEFLTSHRMASNLVPKGLTDGLQFTTTDIRWSAGAGPEVRGESVPMLLTLTGRPHLDTLVGTGVDTLRSRLAA